MDEVLRDAQKYTDRELAKHRETDTERFTILSKSMFVGLSDLKKEIKDACKTSLETQKEVSKMSGQIRSLATSVELAEQIGTLKAHSIEILKNHVEQKHGSKPPSRGDDNQHIYDNKNGRHKKVLLATGSTVGVAGVLYVLLQLIFYFLTGQAPF